MDESFWHEKWESNQIGFHLDDTNPLLINHINKLDLKKGSRIFLPLCGKTLDIAYLLNNGYAIVGIELSEIAIQQLFQDLNLKPTISNEDKLIRYQANGIDIFIGDLFHLDSTILGKVDAIYDRASLVALPLETRQRYTKHLIKITHYAQQLIITFEYDQSKMSGPPFSIISSEISEHYADTYSSIECVEQKNIIGGMKGKTDAIENAWVLKT